MKRGRGGTNLLLIGGEKRLPSPQRRRDRKHRQSNSTPTTSALVTYCFFSSSIVSPLMNERRRKGTYLNRIESQHQPIRKQRRSDQWTSGMRVVFCCPTPDQQADWEDYHSELLFVLRQCCVQASLRSTDGWEESERWTRRRKERKRKRERE